MNKETHYLLHRLWTKAVGTPDYDKSEWKELETVLLRLPEARTAPRPDAREACDQELEAAWARVRKALEG